MKKLLKLISLLISSISLFWVGAYAIQQTVSGMTNYIGFCQCIFGILTCLASVVLTICIASQASERKF